MVPCRPSSQPQLENVMVTNGMQTQRQGPLGRFTHTDPAELNEPLQSDVFLKILKSSFEGLFPR